MKTASGGGLAETRTYRAAGWVDSVVVAGSVFQYAYDGRGNRTSQDQDGQTTTYGYDADDHLTGVRYPDQHATLYSVRPSGARDAEWDFPNYSGALTAQPPPAPSGTSRYWSYTFDQAEALQGITDLKSGTPAGAASDQAGRVTRLQLPGGPAQSFKWDSAGRLFEASVPVASGYKQRTQYKYDARNWRLASDTSVVADPTLGNPDPAFVPAAPRSAQFVWDADGVIAEGVNQGALSIYTRGEGTTLAVGTQVVGHDALGSAVVRSSGGTRVWSKLDAWGNYTQNPPQAGDPTPGYAGQSWDPDAALSYAEQRWHAPGAGRFLSEDPVGVTEERLLNPTGLNPWLYGNGNPARYVDPDGRCVNFFAKDLWSFQNCKETATVLGGYAVGVGKTVGGMVFAPIKGVYTAAYNTTGAALYAATGESQYAEQAQSFNEGLAGLVNAATDPSAVGRAVVGGVKEFGAGYLKSLDEGDLYGLGEKTGVAATQTVLAVEGGIQIVKGGANLARGISARISAVERAAAATTDLAAFGSKALAEIQELQASTDALVDEAIQMRANAAQVERLTNEAVAKARERRPLPSAASRVASKSGRQDCWNAPCLGRRPGSALERKSRAVRIRRGQGLPGFNGNQLMRVEGHAAAHMRVNKIQNAVLDINKEPCTAGSGGGCAGLLSKNAATRCKADGSRAERIPADLCRTP